jgi:hypothetical protein
MPPRYAAAVFWELLERLMKPAHRGLRRALAETTDLIDSTGLRLNGLSAGWAQFCAGVCGAKLPVVYDADADRPIYAAVTAAKVNDITAAQVMPITPGATYVFDLGYYDSAWWARMDAAGCRIVTRFMANTPLDCIEELPVPEGSAILSDRIGCLPARQAKSRRNPIADAVREVRVVTDTGKVLRILSNDLDAPAQEIAVALIAFLILRLAQRSQKAVQSPSAFARLVRANLMHRRPIDRLLDQAQHRTKNPNQMVLS